MQFHGLLEEWVLVFFYFPVFSVRGKKALKKWLLFIPVISFGLPLTSLHPLLNFLGLNFHVPFQAAFYQVLPFLFLLGFLFVCLPLLFVFRRRGFLRIGFLRTDIEWRNA